MKTYLAIEPHTILLEAGARSNSGGGAEVTGIKSDTDALIDGQDQCFIPLPPILDHRHVGGCLSSHHQHPILRFTRHLQQLEFNNYRYSLGETKSGKPNNLPGISNAIEKQRENGGRNGEKVEEKEKEKRVRRWVYPKLGCNVM